MIKSTTQLFILSLTILLVACGGGGGDSASAPNTGNSAVPPPSPPAPTTVSGSFRVSLIAVNGNNTTNSAPIIVNGLPIDGITMVTE